MGRRGFRGEGLVFLAPGGAALRLLLAQVHAGHVGWGFRSADGDRYTFGSTESPTVRWHRTGTRAEMLDAFRCFDGGRYYVRCASAPAPGANPVAALAQVAAVESSRYVPLWNDCVANVHAILAAYRAPELPTFRVPRLPGFWFEAMPWDKVAL
jgi:hypothetical protein